MCDVPRVFGVRFRDHEGRRCTQFVTADSIGAAKQKVETNGSFVRFCDLYPGSDAYEVDRALVMGELRHGRDGGLTA